MVDLSKNIKVIWNLAGLNKDFVVNVNTIEEAGLILQILKNYDDYLVIEAKKPLHTCNGKIRIKNKTKNSWKTYTEQTVEDISFKVALERNNSNLRIWYVHFVLMEAFHTFVTTVEEAILINSTLELYDKFLYDNKLISGYNIGNGLEIYREGDWKEYYCTDVNSDYEGMDIHEIRQELEEKKKNLN